MTSLLLVNNPGVDFNDANIATGSAHWVLRAERFLSSQEPVTAS